MAPVLNLSPYSIFCFTRLRLQLCILLVAGGLAGCTIPTSFFRPNTLESPAVEAKFDLQPLTIEEIDRFVRVIPADGLPAELVDGSPISFDKIDVEDRLSIVVFEPVTGSGSVLGGVGGKAELLINAPVDSSGFLNVPFVGPIKVQGLTVEQLRQKLLVQLRRVVMNPQVQVRQEEFTSKLVTVQGLAGKGGRLSLDRRMQRLSHVLAQVAPDQKNPEMLQVMIRRDDVSGKVRLSDIYSNSRLDIPLHAGDSLILSELVHNVTVLGAVNLQGAHRIPRRQFSVLDAIAQAKGMNEERADPSAVFLFKHSELEDSAKQNRRPVVYRLDLGRPEVILLARRMPVVDNDVILIGDASFTDFRKVATSINAILIGTTRVVDLVNR